MCELPVLIGEAQHAQPSGYPRRIRTRVEKRSLCDTLQPHTTEDEQLRRIYIRTAQLHVYRSRQGIYAPSPSALYRVVRLDPSSDRAANTQRLVPSASG